MHNSYSNVIIFTPAEGKIFHDDPLHPRVQLEGLRVNFETLLVVTKLFMGPSTFYRRMLGVDVGNKG